VRSIAIINVPGITIRNDWSQIISVGGSSPSYLQRMVRRPFTLRINCTAERSAAILQAKYHIPLESSCDQSVDVLTHWDEHFACKMAALLSAVVLLIFWMQPWRFIGCSEARQAICREWCGGRSL
jgi:hypothetical protein